MTLPICPKCRNEMAVIAGDPPFCLVCCDDEPPKVAPITPSHVCASCRAEISTLDVYAGHTDKCMQPEIRMRRLEARVKALEALVNLVHGSECHLAGDTIAFCPECTPVGRP